MQPLTARSPGFSRSERFEPPEGGTPNQPGFMESPLSFFRMHWDHEPRQLVGRGVLTAPRLGGLGTARPTLWFMESLLSLIRVHWDREPADRAVASWTTPVL